MKFWKSMDYWLDLVEYGAMPALDEWSKRTDNDLDDMAIVVAKKILDSLRKKKDASVDSKEGS